MNQFDPCQTADYGGITVSNPQLVWTENAQIRKKQAQFLYLLCQVANPSTLQPNQEVFRIQVLSIEDQAWCNRDFFEADMVVDSAKYWRCSNSKQSALYLYTHCQIWKKKGRVLKKSMDKVVIQQQKQPEEKCLAKLLANQKVIGPLPVYLQETEVGSRE